MQDKQSDRTQPAQREKAGGDPAHQGQKPGKIGEAQVAPEKAPEGGSTGRREFGRDG
jgi:hypothetical protein